MYPKLMAWEGAFGVVPRDCDGFYVSPEFPVFEIDTARLAPAFLGFYFRIPAVWEAISGGSTGTNVRRRRLNPVELLQRAIPLPPLAEQQRVVARIDELATEIQDVRTLAHSTAADADALITSLCVEFAAGRTRALGDVMALDEDVVLVSPSAAYPQVGMKSFGGGLFRKGAVAGAATTYKAFNRLYAGAVVLSQVKGWEGAVAVCPPELSGLFVSPEYRTFRCIPGAALPGYLAPVLRTHWFWRRLAAATRGVGARRERTRPERFLEIEMPMPDLRRQKLAECIFAELEDIQCLNGQTIEEIDALIPTILVRALIP